MKLREEDVAKLESFLAKIGNDVYPEPPSPVHTDVAEKMVRLVLEKTGLAEGSKILDVGCGQGVALKLFVDAGCDAQGIALGEDVQACIDQGFNVCEMDQSFLDFPDEAFDLVWSRHCLEHSIMPYFTLSEMSRVLKPGGHCYVEVPTADTSCMHQNNPNHYSVLGRSMWATLLQRSGFKIT
ncbi:MAG: class I SAM-dependent methyltransferase, partial [Planctomycetota bacterium]